MGTAKPSYEELEARLAEAQSALKAIGNESIDALVGRKGVYLLRLNEMEKALEESEEKFRKAFENAAVGFALTTPDGRFVEANSAFCRITGYTLEDLKTFELYRLLHPDDSAENRELIDQMRAGHIPDFVIENRYIGKDGKLVWVRKSASLVRSQEGAQQWIIILIEDISDRKQLEEALRENNQELTEYAYALTHNIKAPLRAISNYVTFLLEDLADTLEGDPKKFLEGIRASVAKSNKQFADLEALYGIKNHTLNLEAFPMQELLDELQFLFKDRPNGQIIVQENWPVLKGERLLLRQILINLIGNGLKYNQADIKRVEIGWQKAPENRFEIFVRDNGIGIAPQYQEQIFHIFKRLHTDSEYEGTGIGLAIAKRAAQKISGKLHVESAVGKGSTFYINLPDTIVD